MLGAPQWHRPGAAAAALAPPSGPWETYSNMAVVRWHRGGRSTPAAPWISSGQPSGSSTPSGRVVLALPPCVQIELEKVAGAYAGALVEVAQKTSSLEAVHADVDSIAGVLKENQVRTRGVAHRSGITQAAERRWIALGCGGGEA